MQKIVIIGAGPAGLSLAYKLLKQGGWHVVIYEASSYVGGMARSFKLWKQTVDIGPHRFFSSDKRINSLWLEVLKNDYSMVSRKTRILYDNKFFDYPLDIGNTLINLGPVLALKCTLSYIYSKLFYHSKRETFESWVISRFGLKLFNIFFKSYSQKLWGIACDEIDSDFAKQRIKKLSFFEAIRSALFGNTNHKTLVDEFAYPNRGCGQVYELMAQEIIEMGGVIHKNSKVESVITDNEVVKGIVVDGNQLFFDRVVSSMPITNLVQGLPQKPREVTRACKELSFRNTIIVYLNIDSSKLFEDQWLYIHSPDVETGRITNFRNWVPHLYENEESSILALEYWCNDGDEKWSLSERELTSLAKGDIVKAGLAKEELILDSHIVRVPKCYPVYKVGYRQNLKVIQDYIDSFDNLNVIGRYGSFKYNNQDHSILMGILLAEQLALGKGQNLWDVNCDYEYQEKSLITKTGLK